ncbi:MAG: cytochrome c [Chloroflexi bacterium]|nr:cytochrome c [Chloroflexota bacterium]
MTLLVLVAALVLTGTASIVGLESGWGASTALAEKEAHSTALQVQTSDLSGGDEVVLAGLPVENFRNDWPFDPPLPDHLFLDVGANRLLFLHFDKPVAEATKLLYVGVGVKGRFLAEDQPDGGTTGFTHFHRLKAPTVEAGHGGAPGDEGYWLQHIAVSEFEMMGMKVEPGIDMMFMPTAAPSGLGGKWVNERPFNPPLPDHVWVEVDGGRVSFLHFDKPVTDPSKKLLFVGDGVRGRFCAEDQPAGGHTGYVHFHRFDAPTVDAGHGGAPGDEGYWLRHIAVDEIDMMGMRFNPGIAFDFMPTKAPGCGDSAAPATSAQETASPAAAPVQAPMPTETSAADSATSANLGSAAEGEKKFAAVGCIGCHTVKGSGGKVGPELTGIGSRSDVTYIRQSIEDPLAYVVPGYQPVMPSPDKLKLSPSDIDNLVAFLEELK